MELALSPATISARIKISSAKSLLHALQISGRNPTTSVVRQFWERYGPEISDEQFRQILAECPNITNAEFSDALSNIQSRYDAEFSSADLVEILSYGPDALSSDDINEIVTTFDASRSGLRLSTEEMLRAVSSTQEECMHFLDRAKSSAPLGNHLDGLERKRSGPTERYPKDWYLFSSRGFMIVENGIISGNHFELILDSDTELFVEIQLVSPAHLLLRSFLYLTGSVGSQLCFFREDEETRKRFKESIDPALYDIDVDIFLFRNVDGSHQRRLTAFSNSVDLERKFSFRQKVPKGNYSLIPFTSGAWIRPDFNEDTSNSDKRLVVQKSTEAPVLTDAYINALHVIFTMVDLDDDDLLNRQEFECFAKRATGDVVTDADWRLIASTFSMRDGKLTRQGFLEMHLMEAGEGKEEEETDLWIMLESMGFNSELVMDKALIFALKVVSSNCTPILLPTEIEQCSLIAEKAIICAALQRGNAEDLGSKVFLYKLTSISRFSMILENRGDLLQRVQCSLQNLDNCITNREFPFELSIQPRKATIIAHFVPVDSRFEWKIKTLETVKSDQRP